MMAKRGTLTISLDFELGWGVIEGGRWRMRERAGVYRNTRGAVSALIGLCDDLELPMTWATVGAMVDEPAHRTFDHLPADLRDLTHAALREGETPTFDGRDVFQTVLHGRTRHDVGGHGYAHVRFDYPGVDAICVAADLARLLRALSSEVPRPSSFVYPRNREGFGDLVSAAGFSCARGVPPAPPGGRIGRALVTLLLPPPLSQVSRPLPKLCRTTYSHLFNAGFDEVWRVAIASRRAQRGLELAIGEGGTLHVFTHPYDLGAMPRLAEAFHAFLKEAARLRDRDLLSIVTMAELAASSG